MFVMQSTHEALFLKYQAQHDLYTREQQKKIEYIELYYEALNRGNAQLEVIHKLLRQIESSKLQQSFNAEELKKLISLCHPDKHEGRQSANEMTAKLILLKEQL